MKNLTTQEAIDLVDSDKEISYGFIEKRVAVILRGDADDDIMQGEYLVNFIHSFLKNVLQSIGNLEHATVVKYSIDNNVLKGYALNLVISECRAIAYDESEKI